MKMLIDGRQVDAADGRTMDVVNPVNGQVLDKVPAAGKADIDQALAASKEGFCQWKAVSLMEREAIFQRFYRLLDYGEHHLEDRVKIEYFAVSLPDFLILDDDLTLKNRVHCYYLMALGNMGLGNMEKAKGFLRQGLALEPSHMMCSVYAGETF